CCPGASRGFEAFSHACRRQRRLTEYRERRVFCPAWTIGVREDNNTKVDRRFRRSDRGRDSLEWREHTSPETLPAERQHCVSKLRAVSASYRAPKCRVWIEAGRNREAT